MKFNPFPHKKYERHKKHKKDISDLPIQRVKTMSAEEILDEFHMVVYTPIDIAQINHGLKLIREILNKNNGRLKGGKNV